MNEVGGVAAIAQRASCGKRDSRLIFTEAKGNGGTYTYYICRGRQEGFCDLPSLPVDEVEDSLGRHFATLAINSGFVESIRSEVELALVNAQWLDRGEMRRNLRAKLRQIDIKEDRLLDLAAQADLATLRLADRLKALQWERESLLEKLDTTDAELQRGTATLNAYLDMLVDPDALFARADDPARRLLLAAFFSKIYLGIDEPPRTELRPPVRAIALAAEDVALKARGEEKEDGRPKATAVLNSPVGLLSNFFLEVGLSKPTVAGVPGLEPRTKESESSVLPITPYPNGPSRSRAD